MCSYSFKMKIDFVPTKHEISGFVQFDLFFCTSAILHDTLARANLEELVFLFRVFSNHTIKCPPFSVLSKQLKKLYAHSV